MSKIFLLLILLTSCSRQVIHSPAEAMRIAKSNPTISDSLSEESFFTALESHINNLKISKEIKDPMIFGNITILKSTYISALESILNHKHDWKNYIASNFIFLEVYGGNNWGEVFSTGYYEPHVFGSKTKTIIYSQPLLSDPKDIISLDLNNFKEKLDTNVLFPNLKGRVEKNRFIPYFSRKEIDEDMALANKKLEIAWVDPIDAFFIQIQGSGVIEFENHESIRVGYANQNGHSYIPIGKFLAEFIPLKEMSMQKIRKHLNTLSAEKIQKILNLNPSYVFFQILNSKALTFSGAEVSPGRTIATDKKIFPKGALAFFDISVPIFDSVISETPIKYESSPRFVFDQDTGGAINGPGRVDLYFGDSESDAQKAGAMKQTGRLYYLVPK